VEAKETCHKVVSLDLTRVIFLLWRAVQQKKCIVKTSESLITRSLVCYNAGSDKPGRGGERVPRPTGSVDVRLDFNPNPIPTEKPVGIPTEFPHSQNRITLWLFLLCIFFSDSLYCTVLR